MIDNVVPDTEATLPTTPMPIPASTTASQQIPATPTTAKTLLLLASGPKFNRTATQAGSDSTKSSAGHTEKLPFGKPTTLDVIPNAAEFQLGLILANQHQIMAN